MKHDHSERIPIAVVRHDSSMKLPRIYRSFVDTRLGSFRIPGSGDADFISSTPSDDVQFSDRSSRHRGAARAMRGMVRLGTFLGLPKAVETGGSVHIDIGGHSVGFVRTILGRGSSFVHLRGINSLKGSIFDYSCVNIVTGLCLFGGQTVRVYDDSGSDFPITRPRAPLPTQRPVRIHAESELSLYERESMVRLCRSVVDIIDSLPKEVRVTVTVDIPRVQYYCYLFGTDRQRLADADVMDSWFDLVDTRNRRLTDLFTDSLRGCTRNRENAITVEVSNPLAAIEPYIRASVASRTRARLDSMLSLLERAGDTAWKRILTAMPPATVWDLIEASYVSVLLRATTGDCDRSEPVLAIQVDNQKEWPIRSATTRVLGHDGVDSTLLGVYPLEQLIVADEQGLRLDSYCHDPGPRALDPQGDMVNLEFVIRSLYDERVHGGFNVR